MPLVRNRLRLNRASSTIVGYSLCFLCFFYLCFTQESPPNMLIASSTIVRWIEIERPRSRPLINRTSSNTPYALDQAIRWRFDKRIYMPLLDLKASQHMLESIEEFAYSYFNTRDFHTSNNLRRYVERAIIPLQVGEGMGVKGLGKQSASGSRLVKQIHILMLVVLGMGYIRVNRLKQLKEKHTWSVQVTTKLIENSPNLYAYDKGGEGDTRSMERNAKLPNPESGLQDLSDELESEESTRTNKHSSTINAKKLETAMIIAARNGITEMAEVILKKFPMAVNDVDAEKKNIVLLAVETRQLKLYKKLLNIVKDNAFGRVDINGNSALHLAAKLRKNDHSSWPIPGSALQMQWEIKWAAQNWRKPSPPSSLPPWSTALSLRWGCKTGHAAVPYN
ncbi:hypothetical protein TIFTF001_034740 [Ficus carica]|uniref:Uncharacterized protein n=1 Tax=Ficus carica TaxID=3494 RepID=A0AA88E0G3_FICCA|nr:hypothetical protein TIFTF001_034740 [Ficus carica]